LRINTVAEQSDILDAPRFQPVDNFGVKCNKTHFLSPPPYRPKNKKGDNAPGSILPRLVVASVDQSATCFICLYCHYTPDFQFCQVVFLKIVFFINRQFSGGFHGIVKRFALRGQAKRNPPVPDGAEYIRNFIF
jgi:hypothetical protein